MGKPLPYNADRCRKAAFVQAVRVQDALEEVEARTNGEAYVIAREAKALISEVLMLLNIAGDGEIPEPLRKRVRDLANEYGG